jgi:hypothetical protein
MISYAERVIITYHTYYYLNISFRSVFFLLFLLSLLLLLSLYYIYYRVGMFFFSGTPQHLSRTERAGKVYEKRPCRRAKPNLRANACHQARGKIFSTLKRKSYGRSLLQMLQIGIIIRRNSLQSR